LIPPVLLAAAAGPAWADDPKACEEPHELDKYALLRRLSLDLRGQVPSIEEYDALDTVDAVPAETIQAYLESDDFRLAMRRYHEEMFWPNVSPVRLHNQNAVLSSTKETYAWRIPAANRGNTFRGDPDVGCDDYEQTFFDPAFPGEFRPDPAK